MLGAAKQKKRNMAVGRYIVSRTRENASNRKTTQRHRKRIYLAAALVLERFCGVYPAMVSG